MKIAFVVGSLSGGGAERVVAELASDFANRGNKVYIFVIASMKKTYYVSPNVNIINCTQKYGVPGIGFCNRVLDIRKNIKKIAPDVCVSFTVAVNIYSILSCMGMKMDLIIAERNDPKYDPSSQLQRILRNILYPFADKYVFQTNEEKNYFSKKIQFKSRVIPNPINPQLPISYNGERDKRIVTAVRLAPQKNIKLLIDSFNIVAEKYPEFRVEIYGDGPEKDGLFKYIEELGLKSRIKLLGNSKTLYDDIKSAYAFVLPSNYEGMSNSMLEAMALGIPTISTDYPSGGARAVIKSGYNGILVPVNDVDSMAHALESILSNQEYANQLGENGKKIRDELSIKKITKEWINFIGIGN